LYNTQKRVVWNLFLTTEVVSLLFFKLPAATENAFLLVFLSFTHGY